VAIALLRRG